MKSLLVLFVALATLSSYGAELKKTFDGATAKCSLPADAGNSAFRLRLINEHQVKSTRVLSLEISFLKCEESAKGMQLVAARGDEILKQKTILANDQEAIIEHKLLSFSLTAFTESGKLLDRVHIEDLSSTESQVELKIDESVLAPNDEVLINGLGVEAAKISGEEDSSASIKEFISGSYKLR